MHHVIRMTLMQIRECIRMEFRLLLHKYVPAISYKFIYCCIEICGTARSGILAASVGCSARQLRSAAGATGTKQQYGRCNP
jgi:hypothetical protein